MNLRFWLIPRGKLSKGGCFSSIQRILCKPGCDARSARLAPRHRPRPGDGPRRQAGRHRLPGAGGKLQARQTASPSHPDEATESTAVKGQGVYVACFPWKKTRRPPSWRKPSTTCWLKHMILPSSWCHERAATHGACRIYGFAHMRLEVHFGGSDGKLGQTLEDFAVRHQASRLT
jgi:hypothetical protein